MQNENVQIITTFLQGNFLFPFGHRDTLNPLFKCSQPPQIFMRCMKVLADTSFLSFAFPSSPICVLMWISYFNFDHDIQ